MGVNDEIMGIDSGKCFSANLRKTITFVTRCEDGQRFFFNLIIIA